MWVCSAPQDMITDATLLTMVMFTPLAVLGGVLKLDGAGAVPPLSATPRCSPRARASSPVAPVALWLFGGRLAFDAKAGLVTLDDGWIRFKVGAETAAAVLQLRQQLDALLAQCACHAKYEHAARELVLIERQKLEQDMAVGMSERRRVEEAAGAAQGRGKRGTFVDVVNQTAP